MAGSVIGPKTRYDAVVETLEPFTRYSPAMISYLFEDPTLSPEALKLMGQRIRITLGRFARDHFRPEFGEFVRIPDRAPLVGFPGWLWRMKYLRGRIAD